MSKFLLVLSVVLFIAGISFFSSQYSSKIIKLGLVAELSGDLSATGTSSKNGAQQAVDEINGQGGLVINNTTYKVQLLIQDNQSNAAETSEIVTKLVQQGVIAIVGPNASRFAIPAGEVAEKEKTLLISPWSTDPATTINGSYAKRYVFRGAFTDIFQSNVLATYAYQNIKAKKAAMLYNADSQVLMGQAKVFKETFQKLGGTIVADEGYKETETDWTTQFNIIKKAKPDIIFLPAYYGDVPNQIRQAKKLGITAPFLGSDAWGSSELLTLCGKDCEGYHFGAHFSPTNPDSVTQTFIQDYKKRYNQTPDDVAALTYDSFKLLFRAIQTAPELEKQKVRDSLAKIKDYVGVTGPFQYSDQSGDPIKEVIILQIKNGTFEYLTSVSPQNE
jgi:branched-chain amino acid transport system substrate-binding protein